MPLFSQDYPQDSSSSSNSKNIRRLSASSNGTSASSNTFPNFTFEEESALAEYMASTGSHSQDSQSGEESDHNKNQQNHQSLYRGDDGRQSPFQQYFK